MPSALLNEGPQMIADHAALMQRISDIFKLQGIARDYCADGAEDRIEGEQLAFQVSNRLGSLLYTVNEIVDFFA
jgi:hypothetical protein